MNDQDPRNNFDLPLKAPVPNKLGAYMAGLLRQGKEGANNLNAFGIGAGDLIFGDSPKAAEEMSYGNIPHKGSGQTYQLDPSVADLGMLVSAPTAGTIKAAQQGGKAMGKVLREGVDAPFDQSRRKALKIGAGVTAAVSSPMLAIKALKAGAKKALPDPATVVKSAAKMAGKISSMSNTAALHAMRIFGGNGPLKALSDSKLLKEIPDDIMEAYTKHHTKLVEKYGDELDIDGYFLRKDGIADNPLGASGSRARKYDSSRSRVGLNSKVIPYEKNKTMQYLIDDLPEDEAWDIVERWQATGKWPKGREEFMKDFDGDTFEEFFMGKTYTHPDYSTNINAKSSELAEDLYHIRDYGQENWLKAGDADKSFGTFKDEQRLYSRTAKPAPKKPVPKKDLPVGIDALGIVGEELGVTTKDLLSVVKSVL